ncbi:protein ELYS-like, partial [Pyxicephalus adspersus]|uniref:protein ELYS-like n=1 Tax=Pyxicephalus adspersus TaxID=30357 RepID=UPI003B5A7CD0
KAGLAWLACGPQLEVTNALTGERLSAYHFSGVTERPPTVVTVKEFTWQKKTGLLVGLVEAESSVLCLYDVSISRVVKAVVLPGSVCTLLNDFVYLCIKCVQLLLHCIFKAGNISWCLTLQHLEYCEERYSLDLSASSLSLRSQTNNTKLLGCQTIEKFRAHSEREDGLHEVTSPDTSVTVFSWQVATYGHGKPSIYMAVFDINRWYQAQMPDSLRPGQFLRNCSYFAFWSLEAVMNVTQDSIFDMLVHERSFSRGAPTSFPPPEQFYYPSTYNFVFLHRGKWNVSTLMIDGMVSQLGEKVGDLWKRDGGTGKYPPATIHALLDLYLLESADEIKKHAITIYFLLDIMYSFPDKPDSSIESFPTAFSVPCGLIKLIQGFWLLDHNDYQVELYLFIFSFLRSQIGNSYEKNSAFCDRLFVQFVQFLFLVFIVLSMPHFAVKYFFSYFFVRNLIEAWNLQRLHSTRLNVEELLKHMYETCQEMGLIEDLLKLTFTDSEQGFLQRFLQTSGGVQNQELLLVHHLQRANYIPALQLNQSLKGYPMVSPQAHIGQQHQVYFGYFSHICYNNFYFIVALFTIMHNVVINGFVFLQRAKALAASSVSSVFTAHTPQSILRSSARTTPLASPSVSPGRSVTPPLRPRESKISFMEQISSKYTKGVLTPDKDLPSSSPLTKTTQDTVWPERMILSVSNTSTKDFDEIEESSSGIQGGSPSKMEASNVSARSDETTLEYHDAPTPEDMEDDVVSVTAKSEPITKVHQDPPPPAVVDRLTTVEQHLLTEVQELQDKDLLDAEKANTDHLSVPANDTKALHPLTSGQEIVPPVECALEEVEDNAQTAGVNPESVSSTQDSASVSKQSFSLPEENPNQEIKTTDACPANAFTLVDGERETKIMETLPYVPEPIKVAVEENVVDVFKGASSKEFTSDGVGESAQVNEPVKNRRGVHPRTPSKRRETKPEAVGNESIIRAVTPQKKMDVGKLLESLETSPKEDASTAANPQTPRRTVRRSTRTTESTSSADLEVQLPVTPRRGRKPKVQEEKPTLSTTQEGQSSSQIFTRKRSQVPEKTQNTDVDSAVVEEVTVQVPLSPGRTRRSKAAVLDQGNKGNEDVLDPKIGVLTPTRITRSSKNLQEAEKEPSTKSSETENEQVTTPTRGRRGKRAVNELVKQFELSAAQPSYKEDSSPPVSPKRVALRWSRLKSEDQADQQTAEDEIAQSHEQNVDTPRKILRRSKVSKLGEESTEPSENVPLVEQADEPAVTKATKKENLSIRQIRKRNLPAVPEETVEERLHSSQSLDSQDTAPNTDVEEQTKSVRITRNRQNASSFLDASMATFAFTTPTPRRRKNAKGICFTLLWLL